MQWKMLYAAALLAIGLSVLSPAASAQTTGGPLKVVATVPELGSLVKEIGGDQVAVTVFARGQENPHFVDAKPSFIKDLSEADLFLQLGMELETGWVPVLLKNAANGKVLPGSRGFLDASTAIQPMEVPTGVLDRSMGDVHPQGNPHYLTDPLNGLKVAALIRDRLSELRPSQKEEFQKRYETFRQKMGVAMVGEPLARKYTFEKLATLYEHGKLQAFLQQQGDERALGGWLGTLQPYHGAKAVADHNLWPYFSRRFGIVIVGFLEPKPGISPTTRHLDDLIKKMQAEQVKLVLASPFFNRQQIQFVASHSGAKVVDMAHQVGARPGTGSYLSMIDYNVKQVAGALKTGG
jgi:ABC-type Zn uptake system ZnuABC Zn-binding protein ZnuA